MSEPATLAAVEKQYRFECVLNTPALRADLIFCGLADAPLCVTFTERGNTITTGSGFGGRMLLDEGFNVLAIKNAADDWYQGITRELLAQLAACASQFEVRSGYGSSMGAHAAVRFSKALGFSTVWAISPVSDIRHQWDRRYHVDIPKIRGAMLTSAMLNSECRYFMAYDDQFEPDSRHVDVFAQMLPRRNLVKIRVPNAGHPVGPALRDAGILKRLTVSILREQVITLPVSLPD